MSIVLWILICHAGCSLLISLIGRFPCLATSLPQTYDGIRYNYASERRQEQDRKITFVNLSACLDVALVVNW